MNHEVENITIRDCGTIRHAHACAFSVRGVRPGGFVSGHPKCTTNGHFEEAQSAPPLDVI
jgi:hypothetical protein